MLTLDRHFRAALALSPAALLSSNAFATNGYFAAGYGVKAEGVAGVGIAFPQDTLAIAINPAGLVDVPDSFDIGVDVFRPERNATIVQGGETSSYDGNSTKYFYIPALGYVHHFSQQLAAGFALYGNGGLNTDYSSNPFARFGATGAAGVDLAQLFLSPTVSYALDRHNEFGLAVNLAYQRFKAKGIGVFGNFSQDPTAVSDQGYDSSYGIGVRLGYTWHLNEQFSAAVTWQSRTSMSRFTKYQGLFADQGSFDIPSNYGVGLSYKPIAAWTIAVDWLEIRYSEVAAVGNPVNSLFSGVPLGASDGPGFGWRNVSVVKLGTAFQVNERWTVRAGYSDNRQPIPASQTFFNILAPGVVEPHATVGLTWKASRTDEISLSYLHAFEHTVNGEGSIPPSLGGGEANLRLKEDSLGISWSHRL